THEEPHRQGRTDEGHDRLPESGPLGVEGGHRDHTTGEMSDGDVGRYGSCTGARRSVASVPEMKARGPVGGPSPALRGRSEPLFSDMAAPDARPIFGRRVDPASARCRACGAVLQRERPPPPGPRGREGPPTMTAACRVLTLAALALPPLAGCQKAPAPA